MSAPRKFRVWDGEEMYYLHDHERPLMLGWDVHGWYVDEIQNDDTHLAIAEAFYEDHALMQYTGLTDAEGTKIYEGDIVECRFAEGDLFLRGVVEFNEGLFYVEPVLGGYENRFTDNGQFPECGDNLRAIRDEGAVIGNRYENPDLLKELA